MKSLTNLRKGLALVLCAAMLMGDTTMLQAYQVESTTVAALMTKSETEVEDVQAETEEVLTDAEEVISAEEEVKEADSVAEVAEVAEAEETEVAKEQTETTEAPETQQESEKPQVEAPDVETALENKALEATYTATVGETTVTVVAPEGAFTEKVTLQVTEVEITDEMQAQLDEQAIAEQKAIESATAYDISFVNAEGKEVEPAKEVQVSIATSAVNSGDDASVYHFDEEKAALNDMEAVVDHAGDLAFETDHFSTYVIVNNKKEPYALIRIHHVKDGKALYETSERKLAIGSKITDFVKDETVWNVDKITKGSINGAEISKDAFDEYEATSDLEIWVHYSAKRQTPTGDVTFWDYSTMIEKSTDPTVYCTYKYDVYRGTNWVGTFYANNISQTEIYTSEYGKCDLVLKERIVRDKARDLRKLLNDDDDAFFYGPDGITEQNQNTYIKSVQEHKSINDLENYKYDSEKHFDKEHAYLTIGKQDGTNQVYEKHRIYNETLNNQEINEYASSTAKTGIVAGLDDDDEVLFNVNQPGIFTQGNSVGKTMYPDFKLRFEQNGYDYKLTQVEDKYGKRLSGAGSNFYPLNGVATRTEDTFNGGGATNHFFGMRYDVSFTVGDYLGEMSYHFKGDDDLWVLLDGEVIIDLGGIHQAIERTVSLNNLPQITNADKNAEHHLTVLYMERGAGASNCTMEFSLPNAKVQNYTIPTADLKFTKVDANDHNVKLANAEFVLTKDGSSEYRRTTTSDANGEVYFAALIEGDYTLRESAAPDGYTSTDKTWTVKVTPAGENKVKATLYDGDKVITEIENTQEKKEEFSKKAKMIQVDGKDTRTYQIDLNANFTKVETTPTHTETPGEYAKVVLVLDTSSSMDNTVGNDYQVVASGNTLKEALGTENYQGYYVKLDGKYYQINKQEWWNNTCYRYFVKVDGTDYRYYTDDEKWYYGSKNQTRNFNDDHCIYRLKTRLDVLKEATKNLISKLPNGSQVAIVTFNAENNAQVPLGMTELKDDNRELIKGKIDELKTKKRTHASYGFREAYKLLDSTYKNNYVVYFTDGDDNAKSNAQAEAKKLKIDKNATLYAVGILENPSGEVKKHMEACDSNGKPIISSDITNLPNIFNEVASTINDNTQQTTTGETGVVVDTVDSRFYLIDDNGNKVTTSTGENETIKIGGKEASVTVNANKTTTITWNAQSLENWSVSFKIQAQDDFLGGNLVPTNDPSNSYVVDKDHSFEVPYVNVPTIPVSIEGDKETDFLGDWVDSASNGIPKLLAKASSDFSGLSTTVTSLPYSYGGTKFGIVSYSYDTSEGIAGNHELKVKGDAVEKYHMTITYTPLTEAERIEAGAKDKDDKSPNGEAATSKSATGTYEVNVVAGDLKITKTIKRTEYVKAFGDPTFTFKIERTYESKENGKTKTKKQSFYRTVRFMDVASEGSDTVTLSATIKDLPSGTYSVTELRTLGFQQKSAEIVEDETVNVPDAAVKTVENAGREEYEANFTFAMVAGKTDYSVGVGFVNEKKHSPRDTDTDVSKNHFHVEKDSKKNTIEEIKTVDNDVTSNTGGVKTNN